MHGPLSANNWPAKMAEWDAVLISSVVNTAKVNQCAACAKPATKDCPNKEASFCCTANLQLAIAESTQASKRLQSEVGCANKIQSSLKAVYVCTYSP